MKNIINDIIAHTPEHLEGYFYIKTHKLCIPFSKLTLHSIEKDIFSLDPFFLCVMQLVDEGITALESIENILGMTDKVFSEAVVDMAHIDYVSLSEGTINLTNKGRKALAQNKRIERKNIDLQNVLVDLITGKVYDDITYTNPSGSYIPLDPVVEINNEYFCEHFKEIKNLHRLRQKQYQINANAPIEKELEKINGYDQAIVCVEKELYIYKSIESDELQFKINDDDIEGSYLTQFFKQYNQERIIGKQQAFFDRMNRYFGYAPRFTPDSNLLKQTESIRKVILSSAPIDKKEEAFLQRHYALNDIEYVSCITNSSRFFKFDYILIVCPNNINTLLSDSLCSQLRTLSKKIPVFIVYEDDKHKRNPESIKHYFPEDNRGEKLYLFPESYLNKKIGKQESYICYYPKMNVKITRHCLVTEFGYKDSSRSIEYSAQVYDFDEKTIESTAKKIIEMVPGIKTYLEDTSPKKANSQNSINKNVKSTVSSDFSKQKKHSGIME